jgi:hypothetical protein
MSYSELNTLASYFDRRARMARRAEERTRLLAVARKYRVQATEDLDRERRASGDPAPARQAHP